MVTHVIEEAESGSDLTVMHGVGDSVDAESFLERCRRRRARLADDLGVAPDRTRYFPVLAVLAPVMTQAEGEITYPGDPMALYAALSVAVHQAVHDAGPLEDAVHYNDLAPEWTAFPSKAYRASVGHDGVRQYGAAPNTDQMVFDPRVWDEAARGAWIRLLREVRPRVVLISAVSPAHRYALEMAALVRSEVPGAYVVLGGRHADETLAAAPGGSRLLVKPSGTPAVIREGKVPPVIDAIVTGEAYHAVDVLMRALALAIDLEDRWVDRARVLPCLQGLLHHEGVKPGKALVLLSPRGAGEPSHAVPLDGPALDLASLPSPYEAFAIRSYFPIFEDPESGDPLRTAHFMVSSACPYRCNFCSESARVGHGLRRFRDDAIGKAIERICEYVSYGAEAVFFDDSVFWSGRYKDMTEFCRELGRIREADPATLDPRLRAHLAGEDDTERLRNLQWGAQLTVDTLVALHSAEESNEVLRLMRDAGCSYVYIGIESMSSQVMDGIHKNLRREVDRPWAAKVREATALVKKHGLRLGTSVLFGLDGETRSSVDETIHEVGRLIDDGLIDLASPNILTYHPATSVTRQHGMHERLDYHSPRVDNRKPYIYFEEAFPGVVSVLLTEDDIWHIHNETRIHWGLARNDTSVDTRAAGAAPGEHAGDSGGVHG